MYVVFRADASSVNGIGHIMRCLTLAHALRNRFDRCMFVCSDGDDAIELIQEAGFDVLAIASAADPEEQAAETAAAARSAGVSCADWLVVDHYGLDSRYEFAARGFARRVAVIDDLGDRAHDCELLLDQNLRIGTVDPYRALVPQGCAVLLGPRFALVRPEFATHAAARGTRDGSVRRILIFFGGGDSTALTAKALRALLSVGATNLAVDVVVSRAYPSGAAVEALAQRLPGARLHEHVTDMAALMARADLMLGAGGSTAWERCVLGLPSITVTVADNQSTPTLALAERGATVFPGTAKDVTEEALAALVVSLLSDRERVANIGRSARTVTDGRGAALVASALHCVAAHAGCSTLRPLRPDDSALLRMWRNSERVRMAMSCRHMVSAAEHDSWFASTLVDPSVRHSVFLCCDAPLGLVSFKDLAPDARWASWGFYIGEPWAPAGSGSRMAILALESAFGELGLEEIRAEALSDNDASLAFHRNLGFRPTGTVSRMAPDGATGLEWGTFVLTAQDWNSAQPRLRERYFGKGAA